MDLDPAAGDRDSRPRLRPAREAPPWHPRARRRPAARASAPASAARSGQHAGVAHGEQLKQDETDEHHRRQKPDELDRGLSATGPSRGRRTGGTALTSPSPVEDVAATRTGARQRRSSSGTRTDTLTPPSRRRPTSRSLSIEPGRRGAPRSMMSRPTVSARAAARAACAVSQAVCPASASCHTTAPISNTNGSIATSSTDACPRWDRSSAAAAIDSSAQPSRRTLRDNASGLQASYDQVTKRGAGRAAHSPVAAVTRPGPVEPVRAEGEQREPEKHAEAAGVEEAVVPTKVMTASPIEP